MTAFWKGMWLALWLLSQWLGFGLPGLSHAAEQSAPTWPACGQTQPANNVYDAGFLSGLDYGVELPSSTTEGFNEVVAESKATSVYDPTLVSFSQITGSTRAVPAGEVGFLAAKGGGRLGNQATRQHVADVATEMESRGWTITGGGGRLPEEYLPSPGG